MDTNSVELLSDKINAAVFSRTDMVEGLKLFKLGGSRYSNAYASFRLNFILKLSEGKRVLDLGCGTGEYSIHLAKVAEIVYAVDIAEGVQSEFKKKLSSSNISNIVIMEGNLRSLPDTIPGEYFDVVFSYSTLYYVEKVEEAIKQMKQKLKKGGIAVFELGNRMSLNDIICKDASSGVLSFYITPKEMFKIIESNQLAIRTVKRFQLLPMYGVYPVPSPWSRILPTGRSEFTRWLLSRSLKGRMLDEILCSLPLLRNFAFRFFFTVEKVV